MSKSGEKYLRRYGIGDAALRVKMGLVKSTPIPQICGVAGPRTAAWPGYHRPRFK